VAFQSSSYYLKPKGKKLKICLKKAKLIVLELEYAVKGSAEFLLAMEVGKCALNMHKSNYSNNLFLPPLFTKAIWVNGFVPVFFIDLFWKRNMRNKW